MDELTKQQEKEIIRRLDEGAFRISNNAISDGMRSTFVLNRLLIFVATEYTKMIGASATADVFRTCANTIDASDFGQAEKTRHYDN